MASPEQMLNDLPEEEYEALKASATDLLQDHTELHGIIAALIGSRRLYSIAMGALIEALDGKWNAELLRAYYLGATRQQAEQEFSGRELHVQLSGGVLPWLVDEILKAQMSSACEDRPCLDGECKCEEDDQDFRNNGKV